MEKGDEKTGWETMEIKKMLSLLSIASPPHKKIKTDEAIAVALKSDAVQKPLPRIKYITSHFRLLKGDKPMPKVMLKWMDEQKNPLKVNGLVRTNEEGWGMVCIEESVLRSLNSLCLIVTHNKQKITLNNIGCDALREKTRIQGPERYAVEFADSGEPMADIPPKKIRKQKFVFAVSGTAEQLRIAIPLLKKQACIRITQVFLDGKRKKVLPSFGKGIKVSWLEKEMPAMLEEIEFLIDLSNNPLISKLAKAQIRGKRKIKTIIIADAARFLGRGEKIFSYYKQPSVGIKDLTEVLRKIEKFDQHGGR